MSYQQATLTRCEPSFGGYIIRWRAPNALTWQVTLARIKDLPQSLRDYINAEKCWWIDASAISRISNCFANYADVMGCESAGYGRLYQRGHYAPAIPPDVADAFKALHLQPDAPAELVKAAQGILARRCHPDDGDHLAMARLNLNAERALGWAERQHAA